MADDNLLFSVIRDSVITTRELNNYLARIKQWTFSSGRWVLILISTSWLKKWFFSRKLKKVCHPSLRFSNSNISQVSSQKHLGLTLDNRLTFDEYLKMFQIKYVKPWGSYGNYTYITKASTSYNILMFHKTPSRLWWYYLWSVLQLIFP